MVVPTSDQDRIVGPVPLGVEVPPLRQADGTAVGPPPLVDQGGDPVLVQSRVEPSDLLNVPDPPGEPVLLRGPRRLADGPERVRGREDIAPVPFHPGVQDLRGPKVRPRGVVGLLVGKVGPEEGAFVVDHDEELPHGLAHGLDGVPRVRCEVPGPLDEGHEAGGDVPDPRRREAHVQGEELADQIGTGPAE